MRCGRGSRRKSRHILFIFIFLASHAHEQRTTRKKGNERRTHGERVEHGGPEAAVEACDALLLEDALEQRAYGASIARVGLDPCLYSGREISVKAEMSVQQLTYREGRLRCGGRNVHSVQGIIKWGCTYALLKQPPRAPARAYPKGVSCFGGACFDCMAMKLEEWS